MTQVTLEGFGGEVLHTGAVDESAAPGRLTVLSRRVAAVRAVPHLATWVGIAVSTVGVVLLVVAWGKVAGLTNVGLQMPYLVSAGCTGLALVAVGLTVVNLAAKHEDSVRRRAQVTELHTLLRELREALEEDAR